MSDKTSDEMTRLAIWQNIPYNDIVSWKVQIPKKVAKQILKLPEEIRSQAALLAADIEANGPERVGWPHHSQLKAQKGQKKGVKRFHCHLKGGRTTYVACWTVTDQAIQLVEVYYVGTHENAPY